MIGTTTYNNVEVFLNQLQDNEVHVQYQDEATFWTSVVSQLPGEWVNQKGYEITSEFTPDNSHGYISAGGSNPMGGSNDYAKMYVGFTRYRKTIDLDNDTYADLTSGKESTKVDFAKKLARVNASAIREMEEAAMGDGRGIKAVVGSGSTTSSIVLTTTQTTTPTSSKGAEFLNKNHRYALYDSSNALREANIVASAVAKGTSPTLTPQTTLGVTPASTDYLVYYDPGSGTSCNRVPRGLAYLVNNGSGLFQGLLRSDYPELKSIVEDFAGVNLQPSDIMRIRGKKKYRSGTKNGKLNLILLAPSQFESYSRSGINFLQLNVGQKWDGTVNEIAMGDGMIMENVVVDEGFIYFLNKGDLYKIERRKWGFVKDATGTTFTKKSGTNGTGADGVYANLGQDCNLYIKDPRSHAVAQRVGTTDVATSANSWS